MKSAVVHPGHDFGGVTDVPGDKSISHRAAICAALAAGESTLEGFLRSEDCLGTVNALCSLGATASFPDDGAVTMAGPGGGFRPPAGPLDLGNSGTSMRLLAGLLAGQAFTTELTGDASLRSRPMGRIKTPLEQMGARVELLGEGGAAPVRIHGGALRGIRYPLPVASAQVKSCVLLAGLYAEGVTTVVEPRPTRDHTERLLSHLGVDVAVRGGEISVKGYGPGGPDLAAARWRIPGDISSAAFLLLGAAAVEGREVRIRNVGLNPRRTAFLDVLQRMGARLSTTVRSSATDPEPWGEVLIKGGGLRGTEVGGEEIPNLIDELPLVAAAGALAEGETVIRDAAELRVKESDRIATMAANLKALGVEVEERPDGLRVGGGRRLRPAGPLRSFGDHRVAMAMAVLGLYADGPVCIQDTDCIQTSYPGFWTTLKQLGAHVEQ